MPFFNSEQQEELHQHVQELLLMNNDDDTMNGMEGVPQEVIELDN